MIVKFTGCSGEPCHLFVMHDLNDRHLSMCCKAQLKKKENGAFR